MEQKKLDAEELAAEQEALQEKKEEEIREQLINDFGFDEINEAEKIDKLVLKEKEHREKLSQAIGQKIRWRTEAQKPKETKVEPIRTSPPTNLDEEAVARIFDKRQEKLALDALEYPEELKKEIERVAQFTGSVAKAIRDPYIVSKVETYEKEKRVEEATITKTNRSGGRKAFSIENPPDVDMSTEEGRKTWEDYKQFLIKEGI